MSAGPFDPAQADIDEQGRHTCTCICTCTCQDTPFPHFPRLVVDPRYPSAPASSSKRPGTLPHRSPPIVEPAALLLLLVLFIPLILTRINVLASTQNHGSDNPGLVSKSTCPPSSRIRTVRSALICMLALPAATMTHMQQASWPAALHTPRIEPHETVPHRTSSIPGESLSSSFSSLQPQSVDHIPEPQLGWHIRGRGFYWCLGRSRSVPEALLPWSSQGRLFARLRVAPR